MFQVQESTTSARAVTTTTHNNKNDDIIVLDNAIDIAMKKIEAAKNEVSIFRSAQESLAKRKAFLDVMVKALREKKTQLAIDVEIMKIELSDLKDTQNQALTKKHAITTNSPNRIEEEAEPETDKPTETVQTQFDHIQDEDDSMSLVTVVTASTTSTNSRTSSSFVSTKKRRARKSYNSPKKWRRMIRTHRLQSIFFNAGHHRF